MKFNDQARSCRAERSEESLVANEILRCVQHDMTDFDFSYSLSAHGPRRMLLSKIIISPYSLSQHITRNPLSQYIPNNLRIAAQKFFRAHRFLTFQLKTVNFEKA